MQQQISINQALLKQATQMLGVGSPTIAVEEALKTAIRLKQQAKVKDYFGKLALEGNFDENHISRAKCSTESDTKKGT